MGQQYTIFCLAETIVESFTFNNPKIIQELFQTHEQGRKWPGIQRECV